MMADIEDATILVKEVSLHYGNGDWSHCTSVLKKLQKKLVDIDKWGLEVSVIYDLCRIIQVETEKWNEQIETRPSSESLRMVSSALHCLKNTFVCCSRTQLIVAETEELITPLMACVLWTFMSPEVKLEAQGAERSTSNCSETLKSRTVADTDSEAKASGEWKELHSSLASACIACLGNMVAANSTSRRLVWPHLFKMLKHLLQYPEVAVSQMACMIFHNCLLESDLKEEFCRSQEVPQITSALLSLYMYESSHSYFVLLCLALLLSYKGVVEETWPQLVSQQRLLCLDILMSIIDETIKAKCDPVQISTVTFLVGQFKACADQSLLVNTGHLEEEKEFEHFQVLVRLSSFVSTVTASDEWRPSLQEDESLLITTLYSLRFMREGDHIAAASTSREEQMVSDGTHPAIGFKQDLVKIIGHLSYRHLSNQNKVRDNGGILLVLESSQFDSKNPLIKEASIYAVRNLLEGNVENQQIVKNLQLKGVAENSELEKLGMEIIQEGESIRLVQRQ